MAIESTLVDDIESRGHYSIFRRPVDDAETWSQQQSCIVLHGGSPNMQLTLSGFRRQISVVPSQGIGEFGEFNEMLLSAIRQLTVEMSRSVELLQDVMLASTRSIPSLETNVLRTCEDYVRRVKSIEIVQEILVEETEEGPTLWTIIDAPPFEYSPREPIYEAQLVTLRELEGNKFPDFRVVNVSEFPKTEKLESLLPAAGKTLWKRKHERAIPHSKS